MQALQRLAPSLEFVKMGLFNSFARLVSEDNYKIELFKTFHYVERQLY